SPDATEPDHLVEQDVGGEAHHGQVGAALTQDLVAGGERDEVREPLERDETPVLHQRCDGVGKRLDLSGLLHPKDLRTRSSCAQQEQPYLSTWVPERALSVQGRSTVSAIPCPTPMHRVASPRRPSSSSRRRSRLMSRRMPDAPSGCPTAIAPP